MHQTLPHVRLRLENVSKQFAGQRALDGVDVEARAGEVHGSRVCGTR